MKYLLLIIFLAGFVYAGWTDYYRGFKDGWKKCYRDHWLIAPVPPYPDIPSFGRDNYPSGYVDGYAKAKIKIIRSR
jgi:hypothetical protein